MGANSFRRFAFLTAASLLPVACAHVTGTAGAAQRDELDRITSRGAGNVDLQARPRPIIYVDGVQVSPPDTTDVLRNFSPDEIERVEVIKGSAATLLYGPDAAAGVIQIFLKEPLHGRLPSLDSLVQSMTVRVGSPGESTLREPLVLLDDVQVDREARASLFASLGPEQVERIEVWKRPVAARRYGSAAEQGAILIYRKRP